MSTVSGFLVGAVAAATLTVLYAEKLSSSLSETLGQLQPVSEWSGPGPVVGAGSDTAGTQPRAAVAQVQVQVKSVGGGEEEPVVVPAPVGPGLEQRWAEYAARATELEPAGEFPWRECFQRAAASHQLPETLLLAIASGESNFDPSARSAKDAIGLMQIRWPGTSHHLGVVREADLYDPCTNVDAAARYLVELAGQFDDNLHLMLAAYNYGPGRIDVGQVPDGARWYSQYIYQHLQQVLGGEHVASSELVPATVSADRGYQVLMRFNSPQRARDFKSFIEAQVPGLHLQQRSEVLSQHDVVLLYEDEDERRSALALMRAAGIVMLQPQSNSKHYL